MNDAARYPGIRQAMVSSRQGTPSHHSGHLNKQHLSRRTALWQLVFGIPVACILLAGVGRLPADFGGHLASLIPPITILLMVMIATVLLRRSRETWRDLGLKAPPKVGRFLISVAAGYFAVAVVGAAMMTTLLPALGWMPQLSASFSTARGSLLGLVYWLVIAWTSAAIGEELLFRGFLLSRLSIVLGSGAWSFWIAALAQATLFGLAHGSQGAGGVIITGLTGFLLALVYFLSERSLFACICVHALTDTVSLLAIHFGLV